MTIATWLQTNFNTQDPTTYKGSIDGDLAVLARIGDTFAPHQRATPNMKISLDAGSLFNPASGTGLEVATQDTPTIVAPVTNPRNDLVYVDQKTGVIGVQTGAEAASPVDPQLPPGKVLIARIRLATNTTQITNSLIDDLRSLQVLGARTIAAYDVGVAPDQVPANWMLGLLAWLNMIDVRPAGEITLFAGTIAPTGWLVCDGSAVSRSAYAALFTAIGTTFGAGDGSTAFNLPDLRGRFPVGTGTGSFVSSFAPASVNTGTNVITVGSNDSLTNGQSVTYTTTGTTITGLTPGNSYFVIRLSATTIKLASSLGNANAGTAIALTGQGSGTHTLTATLTARSLGAQGGEEGHQLRLSEAPKGISTLFSQNILTSTGSQVSGAGGGFSGAVASNTDNAGDGLHNTVPPYLALTYIIRT